MPSPTAAPESTSPELNEIAKRIMEAIEPILEARPDIGVTLLLALEEGKVDRLATMDVSNLDDETSAVLLEEMAEIVRNRIAATKE